MCRRRKRLLGTDWGRVGSSSWGLRPLQEKEREGWGERRGEWQVLGTGQQGALRPWTSTCCHPVQAPPPSPAAGVGGAAMTRCRTRAGRAAPKGRGLNTRSLRAFEQRPVGRQELTVQRAARRQQKRMPVPWVGSAWARPCRAAASSQLHPPRAPGRPRLRQGAFVSQEPLAARLPSAGPPSPSF